MTRIVGGKDFMAGARGPFSHYAISENRPLDGCRGKNAFWAADIMGGPVIVGGLPDLRGFGLPVHRGGLAAIFAILDRGRPDGLIVAFREAASSACSRTILRPLMSGWVAEIPRLTVRGGRFWCLRPAPPGDGALRRFRSGGARWDSVPRSSPSANASSAFEGTGLQRGCSAACNTIVSISKICPPTSLGSGNFRRGEWDSFGPPSTWVAHSGLLRNICERLVFGFAQLASVGGTEWRDADRADPRHPNPPLGQGQTLAAAAKPRTAGVAFISSRPGVVGDFPGASSAA